MSSMYRVVGRERSVCYVFVSWPFDFHRSTTVSLVFHRKSYYQLVLIDLLIIHVNSTNLSGSQLCLPPTTFMKKSTAFRQNTFLEFIDSHFGSHCGK